MSTEAAEPASVPAAPLPGTPAPEVAAAPATPATAEPTVDAAVDPAAPQVAPAGDAPAADAPKPLWSDEQWTAWDGTKDTLDERYHTVYDRLSTQHADIVANFEQRLADAQDSIRALTFGDEDPHAGKALQAAEAATQAAIARAEAAEQALQEFKATAEAEVTAQQDAEIAKFRADHSWVFESTVSAEIKQAVSKLIDSGTLPTRAGDVFKGIDAAKQQIMAESILRGDSVQTARELADLRTAKPLKEALPKPPAGSEFISGTDPATPPNRRTRTIAEVGTAQETRDSMAERMIQ